MKTMKSAALITFAVAASLALAACGGTGTDNPTDTAAEGGTDRSFVYLTNDPIGVNKFLESGKLGIELAAETYNGTSKTFEGSNEEANRANLEAAVAEAPDVIVMITFDFEDLSKEEKQGFLHFNDLRGTAVTLLTEAGCTIPQVCSITGHTLESANRILRHYLASTEAIAKAAILRFENAPETAFANRLQTTARPATTSAKKG